MDWRCSAIVVAAGSSTRMALGNRNKVFLPLLGVPAIVWTLRAFERAELVGEIVVVCRQEDMEQLRGWTREYSLQKVAAIVSGGTTRQQSVAAGIAAAYPDTDYFAIHDGARPLVSPEGVDNVIRDAMLYQASTLATPVKDTIKVAARNGMIHYTPDRATLWSVQTPQVFGREPYLRAMELARSEAGDYTDDCQLLEHIGVKVHLCMGEYTNLKLTTQDDVLAAEAILKSRGEPVPREGASSMRIGHGYDVHRLTEGRRLILGGVDIPWEKGLLGHSDADVLAHAISDSLLGAACLGDIGGMFPDTDPAFEGADSLKLLQRVCEAVRKAGYEIENIDATVLAQAPKLKPHILLMRENLASACEISVERVSVKATTEEGLGFTGEKLGIAAHSVCCLSAI